MADIIQEKIKELESQMIYAKNKYADDKSLSEKLAKLIKKISYLERAKVIDFKNTEEEKQYIELVDWEQFEKLDKDFQ